MGDAADHFCERDEKYGTCELDLLAVVKPQRDDDAAATAPTTFGELIVYLDLVPGISQMPQVTSRPGTSHIMIGSGKPQSATGIAGLAPATEPDSSPLHNPKPVESVSFNPCIKPSQ